MWGTEPGTIWQGRGYEQEMFTTAILCLVASALAAPTIREQGSLVLDGIPEVSADISARTRQYSNTRSASLSDWDVAGPGMLILTRFGATTQVHHVAGPGADRIQRTFFAEPVSGAALDPADPDGFYVSMDSGGGEFNQIYWVASSTGRSTRLTDGTSKNNGLSVSPAGGRVAWTSTHRNGSDFDLWVADGHDPARARMVAQLTGSWSVLDWSPDGGRVLLLHDVSITERSVWVADMATGAVVELDASASPDPVAHDAAVWSADGKSVYFASDEGSDFRRLVRYDVATGTKSVITPDTKWDIAGIAASRDGKWLAWNVNEGGRSAVYLAPAGKPASAARLDLPLGVVGGFGFDRTSMRLGLNVSSADASTDVYAVDVKKRLATRWTHSEMGGLDASTFVTPELIAYPSFDGRTIPAWVYRPKRATGPVPVVITIHGGPEGQSSAGFSSNIQYLVNELGVAVIAPNVRGSTGYGKAYVELDNGMNRMNSVKDIGALLDWVATQKDLDSRRVAVAGGSYGGFMVLASAVEYSDRLRCGVDSVGISNFVSFLENTQAYRRDLRRVEYGDERIPEMRAFLEGIAPLHNAARIKIPLLVGQGANDPRVPRSEAEQIVAKVRENGVEVGYVLAKDEGHGFAKQPNREAWLDITASFYTRCLLAP
jgi:dipeptidyl aminopeptidase/acylaminoacyl peptidase